MNRFGQYKWYMIGIIGVLLLVGIVTLVQAGRSGVTQPIAFNHKKHIDNNVSCQTCHQYYQTRATAGIPQARVCIACHEDVIYQTREKAKIQRYYQEKRPIPWRQIYVAPDHVFFSHRLHVVAGQVDCSRCHGEVAQRRTPFTKQPVALKMTNCIGCHESVELIENPNECIRCHR